MSSGRPESSLVPLADAAAPRFEPAPGPNLFDDEEESGPGFMHYVNALLRHKWMILGLGIFGLILGVGAGRLIKATYFAQATLQIDVVPRGSQQATGPIRNTQLLDSRGWVDLIRVNLVLDEVVKRRKLYITHGAPGDARYFGALEIDSTLVPGSYEIDVDPSGRSYTLKTLAGAEIQRTAPGDSLGRMIGLLWAPDSLPAGRSFEFTVQSPRDAAVKLGDDIENSPLPPEASFLRVGLRGTDPVEIAGTVNAIAERYVEVATFLKRDKLTQVTEVLRQQLDRSATELRAKENARETFKIRTITQPSDRGATPIATGLAETRDPVRDAFFRLRLDRDSLQNERDALVRAIELKSDSAMSLLVLLGTIPSVRNSPELAASLTMLAEKRAEERRLRLAFGPQHQPLQDVVRTVNELEGRTIPSQIREVISSIDLRLRDVDQRIAASGREMQQIPIRASEEARMERDVLIADNLYTALQAAFEQARLAELSAAPDVRVLDRAKIPNEPLKDQLLLVIVGGFLGGLALGVGLALLLDRFDTRLRYPEEVTRGLGLNILGALPRLNHDRSGAPNPDDSANLLEAMRSIRMNLGYAHGVAGPFVTTITSPGPGDGKSFLSANIARAFASGGRRTVLIDADTRRGVQHRSLGVQRQPGLLDFLSGQARLDEVVRSLPQMGIDFIPCGTRQSGGPELLAGPAMQQLLMTLRGEYQAIIIDSPPLGAGVDPLLLGSLSGSMVLVLRTGVTDRDLAESRLGELGRLPIRVLGAVLNDVEPKGIYRTYAYLPGYRAEDEVTETAGSGAGAGASPATKGGARVKGGS